MIIYKITSPSGKIYIGQTTKTLEKRLYGHIRSTKRGSNFPIHCAIRKYTPENLLWEVLAIANDVNELNRLEIKYIADMNSFAKGYNCTLGGEGCIGYKHSDETKRKLSEKAIGRVQSFEQKQKHSKNMMGNKNPMYGKLRTNEEKSKISRNRLGIPSKFKNIPRTKELKEKLRTISSIYIYKTPYGDFKSTREAIKYCNCTRATIKRRCLNSNFPNWTRIIKELK